MHPMYSKPFSSHFSIPSHGLPLQTTPIESHIGVRIHCVVPWEPHTSSIYIHYMTKYLLLGSL